MIYVLIAVIVFLSLVIAWQGMAFGRTKADHERKLGELQYVIVQLMADNEDKLARLKLSDELREKLLSARAQIDRDLIDMQQGLVEKLSQSGLVD